MKLILLSIFIAFGLLSACTHVTTKKHISVAPVAKPVIPQNESECLAKGGHWASIGLPGTPARCDLKATDGGKACTDSSQCQGECMAPDGASEGRRADGICSEYILNFGCTRRIEGGRVGAEICAD